jgi:hypothetical protein
MTAGDTATAVEMARAAGPGKYSPSDLALLEDAALSPAPGAQEAIRDIRDRFEQTGTAIEKAHNAPEIMAVVNKRLAIDDATGNGLGRVVIPFLVLLGVTIAAAVLIKWDGDSDGIIRFGGVTIAIAAVLALVGLAVGLRDRMGPPSGWMIGSAVVAALALLRAVVLARWAPLDSGPVWFIAIVVGVTVVILYAILNLVRSAVARRSRRRDLASVRPQARAYLEKLHYAFDDSVRDVVRATSVLSEKDLSKIKADRDKAFNILTERDLLGAMLPSSIQAAAVGEVQLQMVLIPLLGGNSEFVKL